MLFSFALFCNRLHHFNLFDFFSVIFHRAFFKNFNIFPIYNLIIFFILGDVAVRTSDGTYKLYGRQSTDIIKCSGFKLSALEIEREILGHPQVDSRNINCDFISCLVSDFVPFCFVFYFYFYFFFIFLSFIFSFSFSTSFLF